MGEVQTIENIISSGDIETSEVEKNNLRLLLHEHSLPMKLRDECILLILEK